MVTNRGQPGLLELRDRVLADQGLPSGMPFVLLCITSLPHREVGAGCQWVRRFPHCNMTGVEGMIKTQEPDGTVGSRRPGLPYGPRARMLLLSFWREVRRTGQREIERSMSFRRYLDFLGLSAGGKTTHGLRDQAERLVGYHLIWAFHYGTVGGTFEERIVDGGCTVQEQSSGRLLYETMLLGNRFFESALAHPMPIADDLIRHLSNRSLTLDVFCWLAMLLPRLERDAACDWPSLHAYFGPGYAELRHFRVRMIEALREVSHLYPQAAVHIDEDQGLTLKPSHPPENAPVAQPGAAREPVGANPPQRVNAIRGI